MGLLSSGLSMTREVDDEEVSYVGMSASEHTTDTIMQVDASDGATVAENECNKALLRKTKSGRWWKSIRKERYDCLSPQ